MKKFLSSFLALVLLVTSFCFADFNAYAKTVKSGKLSASVSSTIYTGNKATITVKYNKKKIKKGATFKSSNKKIATVTKNGGVIKGVKKGNATITVKYKKKTVKLKITVKKASTASAKVGNKTVKFNANGGIIGGSLKTKSGYITQLPVAYKSGYKTIGWFSGNTEYYYGSKIGKSVTLTPKYQKLSKSDYLDTVDIDYITKIYVNAFYDEYQDVQYDSGEPWKNNTAVKKYFLDHSLPLGYCPSKTFNPKAYMQIVKSKYGITLSSYSQALDFYLACSDINGDAGTLKCIHNGGTYDDTFSEVEYEYYQDKYEVYEPGGDNYSMLCGECGKYFYGPTKHDDWALHMFYVCDVLGQPGSGWAPYDDQYRIFYKKEDHEHTDTIRRSYCQNQGKKKKEELLKQEYTPYRTDVAMSYPPTGPVLWYVDKF